MKKNYFLKNSLVVLFIIALAANIFAQEGKSIAFVTAGSGKLPQWTEDEAALLIMEELGYTVDIIETNAVIPDISIMDAYDGIVISSSISSGNIAPIFADGGPGKPVLAWEYGDFDEMQLGSGNANKMMKEGNSITLVSDDHYIVGELTGDVPVQSTTLDFSIIPLTTVAPGAVVLATFVDVADVENACLVAMDVDGELVNGQFATQRSVAFYFNSNHTCISEAPEESLTLFKNAVLWVMSDDKRVSSKMFKNLSGFNLSCHPNPVSNSSVISFKNAEKSDVNISLLNALGQNVSNIYSGNLNAGNHDITWNNNLSKGMYFIKLQVENKIQTIKVNVE